MFTMAGAEQMCRVVAFAPKACISHDFTATTTFRGAKSSQSSRAISTSEVLYFYTSVFLFMIVMFTSNVLACNLRVRVVPAPTDLITAIISVESGPLQSPLPSFVTSRTQGHVPASLQAD
jgi:hypothetical protein